MDGAVEAVRGADPAPHRRLCHGVFVHVLPWVPSPKAGEFRDLLLTRDFFAI